MTRETTAARVRDLAGPLGPFRSIEQQARDTDNWLDSMGSGAIDVLVDFFIAPPTPNELQHVDPEEFADIVDELLCRVATIRPLDSVPLLATYLADDRTRSHVADALGAAGSEDARDALAAYLTGELSLGPEDLARLGEAIAEIGGSGTQELLEHVLARMPETSDTQPLRERIYHLITTQHD
jgi:hypothetical protein